MRDYSGMTKTDTPKDALIEAIGIAGGPTKLGAMLDVKQNVIGNWLSRGVPDDKCAPIEQATGVAVERLRPDLPWHRASDGHIYVRMTA